MMKRYIFFGMPLLFSVVILAGILLGFSISTAAGERIYGLPLRANHPSRSENGRTSLNRELYSYPAREACNILLVEDDWDFGESSGGGRPYYTSTLDALMSYPYTVWDTDILSSPTAVDMASYDVVIWFTGYDWQTPVSASEESELITYLQEGGSLFMSNQDQYSAYGLTPLMTDYFWIESVNDDVVLTGTEGNVGDPLFAGLGPYDMGRPDQWSVYWPKGISEGPFDDNVFVKLGGFEPLIYSDTGIPNSTRFAGDGFKTIYLGFPYEWLPDINDRIEILGAALGWMCGNNISNLVVTKNDDPDPVMVGEALTYTIVVENLGPNDATGVMVTDTLPADVTYVSSSWVGCIEVSGVVTCDIGDLVMGGSVTFTIVGMAPETAGVYINQVEVMGNEVDEDLTNNTATEDTAVAGVLKIYLPIVSR